MTAAVSAGVDSGERRAWMGVLARVPSEALAREAGKLGALPAYRLVKPTETGTVMVEGRAGGAGRRFNAGEATVTRAVVALEDGTMGFSYALGTDRKKAELAAVLDALLQRPGDRARVEETVIAPLARQLAERQALASRKAAATKVDFFTLVRGDG